MKYAALILGLAILMTSVVAAAAAEIPKQYRGAWCDTQWRTIYKRCSNADFEVERTYWTTVDETCTLSAIRKSKYGGHKLSAVCHGDHLTKEGKPTEARWWLGTNNTRLQVIEKEIPE